MRGIQRERVLERDAGTLELPRLPRREPQHVVPPRVVGATTHVDGEHLRGFLVASRGERGFRLLVRDVGTHDEAWRRLGLGRDRRDDDGVVRDRRARGVIVATAGGERRAEREDGAERRRAEVGVAKHESLLRVARPRALVGLLDGATPGQSRAQPSSAGRRLPNYLRPLGLRRGGHRRHPAIVFARTRPARSCVSGWTRLSDRRSSGRADA